MSCFQMFASPLVGWYWIVAAPHATQGVFGGLSAPLSDWVRLRLFDGVFSAGPRSATTHGSRQSHCCARGHAFGASG
jgi:hypothetical protein